METKTTKDKLLEILGDFAVDDLSTDRLLDVLADKLKRQEESIEQLLHKNDSEYRQIRQERETLQREYQELRRNPATIFGGPFFFIGDKGAKYFVQINRGHVEAFEEREKGIHYPLQRITHEQYEANP